MGKKKDLTGKQFGKLTVISETEQRSSQGGVLWSCLCDCGTTIFAASSWLTSGNTKSCGCTRKESLKKRNTKHSLAGTRLHRIWSGMLTRCLNPNSKQYDRYGGRGITVCERWNPTLGGSFQNFLDDMQESYSEDMTLEREDVNKEYSTDNCEWISKKEQALNKGRYKK